jgi:hypothetical protein
MQFTTKEIIGIYNIIFHILNFLLKIGIQMTFGFYINYNEVNINNIYRMIFLNLKEKLEKKLLFINFNIGVYIIKF